jgi:hypothetical protein
VIFRYVGDFICVLGDGKVWMLIWVLVCCIERLWTDEKCDEYSRIC